MQHITPALVRPVWRTQSGSRAGRACGVAPCATADRAYLLLCIVARLSPLDRAATCPYPHLTDSAGGFE